MPSVVVAWLLLADLGTAERAQRALEAAAGASPRPAECAPRTARSGAELWERARGRRLDVYCAALARGFAQLARAPQSALEEARKAENALPGHDATRALSGRALLRLGELEEAYSLLKGLSEKTSPALADPAALHDLALVELRTGRLVEALNDYRTLVPRAELLEDVRDRDRVFVEAGALAMALGAARLSEAIGYLGEARRALGAPGLSDLTVGLLSLALDRASRPEQARSLAREASGPWALERFMSDADRARAAGVGAGPRAPDAAAPPAHAGIPALVEGELHAVIATLAERADPKLARAQWTAYLASPAGKGPWAEHARKKLAVSGERRGGG